MKELSTRHPRRECGITVDTFCRREGISGPMRLLALGKKNHLNKTPLIEIR